MLFSRHLIASFCKVVVWFASVAVFCGIYVSHGLLKELKSEIYMFVCAAAFVLLYCIVEYVVNNSHHNQIKLVMLCILCSFM